MRNFLRLTGTTQPESAMLPESKLDALLARHAAVEAELAQPVGTDTLIRLSREFAELGPIAEIVKAYRAVGAELEGLEALIADPATEPEMRDIATAERPALEMRQRSSSNSRSGSISSPRMRWTSAT